MTPEAIIAAQSELYRALALRFTRSGTRDIGEFDPVNLFEGRRPVTEDEARAEATEMAANFEQLLRIRHKQGLTDTELLLGVDLLISLAA